MYTPSGTINVPFNKPPYVGTINSFDAPDVPTVLPITWACCPPDKEDNEVMILFKEVAASVSLAAISLKTSAEAIIGETNKIVAKKTPDNRVLNEKLL